MNNWNIAQTAGEINAGRHGLLIVTREMEQIPSANHLHADRYDTDYECVVHLWNDAGQSWDIRVPKAEYLSDVEDFADAPVKDIEK